MVDAQWSLRRHAPADPGAGRSLNRPRHAEDQALAPPSACEGTMGVVAGAVRAKARGEALNPLTISHTPMNSSHRPPGIVWIEFRLNPSTSSTDPPKMTA